MILSRYVRVIPLEDGRICLYETMSKSLVVLPSNAMKSDCEVGDIGKRSISALSQMGYFASEEEAQAHAASEIDNSNKLFISVELSHLCNLRCPYCYQGNEKGGSVLDNATIDALIQYFETVHSIRPFDHLYLKVLGGEPTITIEPFLYLHERAAAFCGQHSVDYHLLIDTNGTNVDEMTRLEGFDTILLRIPLSYKECHNSMRHYSDGSGTYDEIVENVNILKRSLRNVRIVLRHNTDHSNISFFADFAKDISQKCDWKPWISVNYTANMNGDEYENQLTYEQFLHWSSTEAIDVLLDCGLPILASPPMSIEDCQRRSTFSLKLFSDGTAGWCAMDHGDRNRPRFQTCLEELKSSKDYSFFAAKIEESRKWKEECLSCPSLFLCGGAKRLPCICAVSPEACNQKASPIVDIDGFVRTYIQAKERGLGNLFVVFEGGEGYK